LKTYVHRIRGNARDRLSGGGVEIGQDDLIQTSVEDKHAYRINPTRVDLLIMP